MENIYPDYYRRFHCVGGECPDSCCIGWEIEIDDEAMEKYKSAEGELGRRLRENISDGCFVLNGERCPFLNEKNLCDIIRDGGEDMLCTVCTEFPRFTQKIDKATERGLGLACPEAARIILSADYFEEYTECLGGECPDGDYLTLKKARQYLYEIARNNSYPLIKRLYALESAAAAIQDCIDFDYDNFRDFVDEFEPADHFSDKPLEISYEKYHMYMKKVFERYRSFEMINEGWFELLDRTEAVLEDDYEEKCRRFDRENPIAEHYYEQMICSYIYRYFSKAYFDGDVYTKVMYGVFACLVVHELDCGRYAENGIFGLEESVDTVHLYSREIEYSQENLDMLAEAITEMVDM